MKKLLISSILAFSFSSYGAEYILYPQSGKLVSVKEYLENHYQSSPRPVFSSTEVQNIGLSEQLLNAVKVKIPDSLDVKFKDDVFLKENTLKVEENSKLKFLENKVGEYEHFQWGRINSGDTIQLKQSDIDRLYLPAKKGEDINLGSLKEVEGRKIRVAIVDSGIDLKHPEFAHNVYRNESECAALELYKACLSLNKEDDDLTKGCHDKWAKVDTDQNGYPLDCHGWNVAAPINPLTGVQGNNDVSDLVGHGTHISGIIAAAIDDQGTSGVISNVEILPVKVSGSTDEVQEDNTTDIFAKGILYALKQKADVINLSVGWASNEDSLLVSELIKKAQELGVLVVVAGGNSAHSTETYPCAYNEVICVGSHNPDGSRSHFSNFGTSIDIYAPGHNILSTWPLDIRPKIFTARHGYEFKNGTSFSAPYVVGVLARLLNLGFSPDEARVKLLAGARRSALNPHVANGNADLVQAQAFATHSFIYPYKKSSALMNWHEGDRKMVLKLKNYLAQTTAITLKLVSKDSLVKIKDDHQQFESWAKDEIKDVIFHLDGNDDVPSDMNFDLVITSADESKSYPVQAVATTVVHDKFSRQDAQRFMVQTNRDLEKFDFTPFENLSEGPDTDILLSQLIEGKLAVAVLKLMNGSYKLSKLMPTVFDKARLIQAARIDVDLDGKVEYVMTGMYQNKDKKWTAKFYVFDENFRPSPILICPENEFVNLLTSMGTELHWIKKDNRMVPLWIAIGYSPSIDLPAFDPWSPKVVNGFKKRMYFLDAQGLRTLTMPSVKWADFSPLEFFPQNKDDLKSGKVKFLYTLDQGFTKTYSLADTKDLAPASNYVLSRYQNLYPIDGLSFNNTQDVIFSETDAITGAGRLSVLNPEIQTVEQHEYDYTDPMDPIQLVVDKTPLGNFFAHTKYNLLYLENGIFHKTESRNVDNQIQYKRIKGKEALYLSSQYTPGLSSELIQFRDGMISRPAKYRFLVGNGCHEIGYNYSIWDDQDQILFYCDNSKSIFKIKF